VPKLTEATGAELVRALQKSDLLLLGNVVVTFNVPAKDPMALSPHSQFLFILERRLNAEH